MKSPSQEKLKEVIQQVDQELAGRTVSDKQVATIGRGLFELSRIFLEVEKSL